MIGYQPLMSFTAEHVDAEDVLRGDETATVALLNTLARGGPVLELAIGSGRIAIPLAATGLRVDGIDFSEAMVARLRSKQGGEIPSVLMGNFADVAVPDSYRLIYIVFNSFFNLLSQDEQVQCFQNVAAHLTDDGVFIVEAFVPAFLHRLSNEQHVEAEVIGVDEV